MGKPVMKLHLIIGVLAVSLVNAEDPYLYYTWTVTYGTRSILGVPQQVILINNQFPGPKLDVVTNNNIILNLINKLDQPFLLTWNGVKQRKNSWQDGVLGTNCPIPPNSNYTYKFQAKDQIGSYTYFPSTLMHRAAGGFGALNIYHRSVIPIPYANPDGDFTLLIGDWYKTSHKALQQTLDSGKSLPFPHGVLINGQTKTTFTGEQGKTYMFRISNVGLSTSLNFRIQGHSMKLVEVEGSHVIQNLYDSLDVHVGQSVTVLVTLNQPPKDYYIVASTRFTRTVLTATAVLHYANSQTPVSGPLPAAPAYKYHWSMQQARTYRWNLTSNAARPNPQGSFHYGKITPTKTIVLANSVSYINGKLRYAVNGVSYVNADTPLKLADYFNIPGIFSMNAVQGVPSGVAATVATSVMPTNLHDFLEVVFQNNENTMSLPKAATLFLLFFLLLLSSTTTSNAHNITRLLAKYPQFSTFNHYLTTTHLASQINRRQTITVLALDNTAMSSLLAKHYSLYTLKNILSLHVLVDYFGSKKLHRISKRSTLTSTMFQATGAAPGTSGYVNITNLKGGKVGFGAEDNEGKLDATFVKSIKEIPYNISIVQISHALNSDEAEAPTAAPSQLNLTEIMSKQGCKAFADLLTASGADDKFNENMDAGLTVFCPTDGAVKSFMPKYKNLTSSKKVSLLLYHGIPVFMSLQMLKTNNGVMNTLATDGANSYDFSVSNEDEVVSLDTTVVTSKVLGILKEEEPLIVFKINKVLMPKELFKPVVAKEANAPEADAPADSEPADAEDNTNGVQGLGGGRLVMVVLSLWIGILLI